MCCFDAACLVVQIRQGLVQLTHHFHNLSLRIRVIFNVLIANFLQFIAHVQSRHYSNTLDTNHLATDFYFFHFLVEIIGSPVQCYLLFRRATDAVFLVEDFLRM